jgi:transcriptional regulator NrdR family protein
MDHDGIRCPKCANLDLATLQSRPVRGKRRRRKKCKSCGYRLVTWEFHGPEPKKEPS